MPQKTILETIGNTPLVKLDHIVGSTGANCYAKFEGYNLTGSMKARSALGMIEAAEKRGELKQGYTIIEQTSGNLGYALAAIGSLKGYRVILVVDPKADRLKRNILKAYSAELIEVTEMDEHGAYHSKKREQVLRLLDEVELSWTPLQHHNRDNLLAHYNTTGPEIYNDMKNDGGVDILIGAIGTCGHLGGAAKYLLEQNHNIRVIGVEPEGSVLTGKPHKPSLIQGSGLSFIPDNLDRTIIKEIEQVSAKNAFYVARELGHKEAILSGSSAGV